ncbi:MAG: hypothetical protein ABI663_16565 [Chryseolinea sp.]
MAESRKIIPVNRNGDNFFSKRSTSGRIFKWLVISIISLGVLIVCAGYILSYYGQKKAETEFRKVNGTFSSLKINLFERSVTVHHILWKSSDDSTENKASIGRIKLQGISLFQLIINKQLHAQTLRIDSGAIQYQPSLKKDTTKTSPHKSFPFEIENVILRDVFVELKQDSVTKIEALLNLRYGALKVDTLGNLNASLKSAFHYFQGDIAHVKVKKAHGLYASHIDKIEFDSENESLSIDSLKLIPTQGKYEFAHVKGKQVSRLDLTVRNVAISGLNYSTIFDSLISIRKVAVHAANLHSFRDKRMPFKNGVMEMPMKSLQKLQFALEIDSITIDSTMITVEEFAEQATQPGLINFQNLTALMTRLSNRYYNNKPKYSQLDAHAKLMGSGLITASFRFPLDDSPLYSAKGKIANMPLAHINPILENSALLRIESGQLNELYFNFNYTDFKSEGAVEINYDNLQLTMLNADKEKSTDKVKTVLINAFLKKTKDESTEQRKRTGAINIDRDRHRFIFNLWWKSLQDGLKSSVLGNEKNERNN